VSALEAGPKNENAQERDWAGLQEYLGQNSILAVNPQVIPFIRRWSRGQRDTYQVIREELHVHFKIETDTGIVGDMRHIATPAEDELAVRRFTAQPGIDWEGATIWEVHSQNL
jgi:hypothetical protein